MTAQNHPFDVKAHKLKSLLNRSTPSWALLVFVLVFAYFFWVEMPDKVITFWLIPAAAVILFRALWLFPYFKKTKVTADNVDRLLRRFTISSAITSSVWAFILPFFFTTDSTVLLLVFFFTFFIFIATGAIALASHMPAFIAYWLPFIISLCVLFLFSYDGAYSEFGYGFLMFNIFIGYLYRATNREVVDMMTLQIEKQNLADRLQQEKRIAEQSVIDKNRFLAAASHDLRQPLHSAGLYLSALQKHVTNEESQRIFEGVSASVNALNNSFKSLLDVSKLDAGVVEVHKQHFHVLNAVSDVYQQLAQQATDKGLTFTLDGPQAVVYTDSTLLARILRNLLSNAISYTEKGSVSVIWQCLPNKNTQISITDTGVGIPDNELDNIFSEYYQLHNPERDRSRGFGLGLAIVKRLCGLLEIPLKVKSNPNHGTEFILTLENGDVSKVINKHVDESEKYNLSDKRVLVIDDDLSVLNSMTELLSSWGCSVYRAESEADAVRLMTKLGLAPQVIVADYRLRDNLTGVGACERIAEEFNLDIPSIIATGDTSPERLKQVTESGYQILHKPVAPEELRAAIHTALLGRDNIKGSLS